MFCLYSDDSLLPNLMRGVTCMSHILHLLGLDSGNEILVGVMDNRLRTSTFVDDLIPCV